MKIQISLEDLINAYRKAKVDSFYENGHLTSEAFADYEQNLIENLQNLSDNINSGRLSWVPKDAFIGTFTFSLKKVEFEPKVIDGATLFYSNSKRNWNNLEAVTPEFRLLGKHSVDFHVFSSLWIEKVGMHLEKLISESSYGCRLRYSRKKNDKSDYNDSNATHTFSHFRSYLSDYQRWQYNGIAKVKKAISENKKVVAITADLKKYYHRIDPFFIKDPNFMENLGFDGYDEVQERLNDILLHAISSWGKKIYENPNVPLDFKYNGHCGVPMGLGAAKVIANLLLTYLDKKIETELKPIYYGRYVDDLFLVLEDGNNLKTPKDFWGFVSKRITNLKTKKKTGKKSESAQKGEYSPKGYIFEIPYSHNSLIEFGRDKERYFFLEGISGESFLDTLKESLEENSSEWNLPPNADHDLDSFSEEMANASSDHQESANGLRKSDGVSIRRLKLILYLKRFEISTSLLPKKHWEKSIEKFFLLLIEYIITPGNFATYSKYYSRILALAIKIARLDFAKSLLNGIKDSYSRLKELTTLQKNDETERKQIDFCLNKAQEYQEELLIEAIYSSFDPISENPDQVRQIQEIVFEFNTQPISISETSAKLFFADLHQRPFKEIFLYPIKAIESFSLKNGFSLYHEIFIDTDALPKFDVYKEVLNSLWKKIYPQHHKDKYPLYSLYFFTRPFTLLELSVLYPDWPYAKSGFKNACKLFYIDWEYETEGDQNEKDATYLNLISLKATNSAINRTMAFTSLETKIESWVALVREDGYDPDSDREQRILDLSASILKCKKAQIDYVLFPELSIPRKLLFYLSNLFLKKKISIIAGFEYKLISNSPEKTPGSGTGFVSNQLFYILCIPGKTYTHHISIIQEKVIPALEEERELFNVGGKYLVAEDDRRYLINHGGFWFSGLICNDFLNIENRSELRGLIDALIVVEWNKDIKTYNSLVEASANDIHAFILQVNNRAYGDTRLRGPYKEDYERDKVRVRGGELDYYVVATLEVEKLREFQRNHRSPEKPFKPVPTGFEMSDERRKIIKS